MTKFLFSSVFLGVSLCLISIIIKDINLLAISEGLILFSSATLAVKKLK